MTDKCGLDTLIEVVRILRSEQGCPWDRKQTHSSLRPYMLEEAYEAVEAIDQADIANLREELGDVLLQVALHSVIAEEQNEFTIEDVVQDIAQKMVRRHPHVFGASEENSIDGVPADWEGIKRKEHKEESVSASLSSVPKAMPAAMRAQKVQKKVAKAGIGLDSTKVQFELIENTIKKLHEKVENHEKSGMEEVYGELLFEVTNLATILGLNAENSLTNAVDKFINRFVGIERIASREGKRLSELSINYENELWKLNKNKEQ